MDLDMTAVPVGVLVALGLLVVVQVVLDVIALVDLYRRPTEQVTFANKWIWLAIILLVSTLGAIVYLVAGRRPADQPDDATRSTPPSVHPDTVADTLYGAPDTPPDPPPDPPPDTPPGDPQGRH